MLKKINLQFLISYLGLFPFLVINIDKFFFQILNHNIMEDFIFYYSLIIFVFIGAINWNLKKNISIVSTLIGFIPSFLSIFLIIFFLYSYEVYYVIIVVFLAQLMIDNFIYINKSHRIIFFRLRLPLTLLIVFNIIIMQL